MCQSLQTTERVAQEPPTVPPGGYEPVTTRRSIPTMKVRSLLFAGAAAAALAAPGAAHAQATDTTSVTLSAGSLTFPTTLAASNFPATQLNGQVQTLNAAVGDWSVNDATGALLGWTVQVKASQFTDNNGTAGDATDDKTLPPGSLTLALPTVGAGASQSSLLAPVTLAITPIDTGVNQILAQAIATEGSGLWNFTQGADDLTLVVPPTVKAGTYTSTITTTLSAGVL